MTKLRYPPKTDTLFKLFFTRNIGLLHSFLSAALEIPRKSISELTVTNPEILPDFASGKTCRLDLRLTADGQVIDVEIQVENEGNYRERSLVYLTKLLNETIEAGQDYKTIPKVILISIVDFTLFDCGEYHSEFRVMEKTRHEELTDKFAMHYFELPKAPKEIQGSEGIAPWLALFRAETEEDLDKVAERGGEMKEAVEQIRYLAGSPEYLHLETLREMARLDEGQKLSNAEERGEQRGYAKRQPEVDALKTSNDALKTSNDALQAEIAELRRRLGER
jgi:predicted transposase/invertase (TIGR01784 family)